MICVLSEGNLGVGRFEQLSRTWVDGGKAASAAALSSWPLCRIAALQHFGPVCKGRHGGHTVWCCIIVFMYVIYLALLPYKLHYTRSQEVCRLDTKMVQTEAVLDLPILDSLPVALLQHGGLNADASCVRQSKASATFAAVQHMDTTIHLRNDTGCINHMMINLYERRP